MFGTAPVIYCKNVYRIRTPCIIIKETHIDRGLVRGTHILLLSVCYTSHFNKQYFAAQSSQFMNGSEYTKSTTIYVNPEDSLKNTLQVPTIIKLLESIQFYSFFWVKTFINSPFKIYIDF